MHIFTRLLSTTVLTFAALACNPASAQQTTSGYRRVTRRVVEHRGWLKARDFQDLGPQARLMYISGLMDGWYMAPTFGAPDNDKWLISIETCVEGMKGSQVAAIIDKYIKDHPENWDFDLKDLAYSGIHDACVARGQWQH